MLSLRKKSQPTPRISSWSPEEDGQGWGAYSETEKEFSANTKSCLIKIEEAELVPHLARSRRLFRVEHLQARCKKIFGRTDDMAMIFIVIVGSSNLLYVSTTHSTHPSPIFPTFHHIAVPLSKIPPLGRDDCMLKTFITTTSLTSSTHSHNFSFPFQHNSSMILLGPLVEVPLRRCRNYG